MWGTLECCQTFPVIDDIPILLTDRVPLNTIGQSEVLDQGPSVAELVAMVRGSDPMAALVRLLAMPIGPWPLSRLGPLRTALTTGRGAPLARSVGNAVIRRQLARRDELATEDWLACFYLHQVYLGQSYSYFLMRLSQPRQLAFLALLQVLPSGGRVLDLGCGFGHVTWQMIEAGHDVIGIDYNFAQVWVARWTVAPRARFVCADATNRLPLDDGDVAAAWFADSVALVPGPQDVIREMRRCAGSGPVILPRIGNAAVPPAFPEDLTVEGWRSLLGDLGNHRLLDEAVLVHGYLSGRAPDLRADSLDEVLQRSAKLYAVLSDDPTVMRDYGPLPDPPPHARGQLIINPLYIPVGGDGRRYRLAFPSDWYIFEDGGLTRFHDHQAALTDGQLADLRANRLSEELRPLVDGFVVIGAPASYTRRQRRRFKLRAYQIMTAVSPRLIDIPDAAAISP